jgi:hypothetical protein
VRFDLRSSRGGCKDGGEGSEKVLVSWARAWKGRFEPGCAFLNNVAACSALGLADREAVPTGDCGARTAVARVGAHRTGAIGV